MANWLFEKLAGGAVRRDPNETQLFKTEQAEEGEYAGSDALVREILQNSMDAAVGKGPVRIRLALHGPADLPSRDRLSDYFRRLASPLAHRDIDFDAHGAPMLAEGFLVCEDFGTRGLGGDPLLARDPDPGSPERQDFFWFWRNIGRSGKTGDDLGRWGLGKTVYRAASQVGCMLGLTVRSDDARELLMGQAVLRIHEYQGREYVPEGYWCAGVNEAGLPLPIEGRQELVRFREEWRLSRRSEPGLSVVVPYVAPELKGVRILQAVCVHFFLPILQGELIVELSAPDIPNVRLDETSLAEWCREVIWDGPRRTKRHVAPPISFVTRCLAARDEVLASNLLGRTRLPELNDESFESQTLARLRDDFASERMTAIRIRLSLPRKRGADQHGEMLVFLQRQPEELRSDTYYVREGMTITKLNSRAAQKGVQAFVTIEKNCLGTTEKNPLASLLGDSEGPAHEDWDTSEERPDRYWSKWKGRVKFCRRIVDGLVELLQPPTKEPDFELLSDFFSIERTAAPQRGRRPDENGHGPPDFAAITSPPRWYRLDGRRGGFRLTSSNAESIPENARLKVSVAYDLPSGNPLKKWSALDFDFGSTGSIAMRGENVTVRRLAGNILLLMIEGQRFSFSADGFDEYRDLLVRIDEVDETAVIEETIQ